MKHPEYFLPASIILAAVLIAGAWVYTARLQSGVSQSRNQSLAASTPQSQPVEDTSALEAEVWPQSEVELPVKWGSLGKELVSSGVIDQSKFEEIYQGRGGLSQAEQALLVGDDNGNLKINQQNSGVLLNLLWALGLANKNVILEKGPMNDPQYGGAEGFASTGGWSLAKGNTMDHYSKHKMVALTPEQQSLVEKVSKNIYRPCCGNATYFPDCNHGMAMLGLLELGAQQGLSEQELYKVALTVNSYWFPDTYLTIAKFLKTQGRSYGEADPAELLGYDFSSSAGSKRILSQVAPVAPSGGQGCGV